MIVLQLVAERITSKSLDQLSNEVVFNKMHMNNSMYNPPASLIEKIAPTEYDNVWRKKLVRGTVHDETAAHLHGVSGNAGLFSNAKDMACFMQI